MQIDHIEENLVRVTMRSMFTGKVSHMDLPIREGQIHYWKQSGEMIQNVFPHLSADEREFLKTGVTPDEWHHMFGENA